jgi:hypothetical protein
MKKMSHNKFWAMEKTALASYRKFRATVAGIDSLLMEKYVKKLQTPD